MHKMLSFAYVLIVIGFAGGGFQLYFERGAGLATTENLFVAGLFLISVGFVGYLHYLASKNPGSAGASSSVFNFVSTLNIIISILVLSLYFFAYENGGLFTAAMGFLMIILLILSFIFGTIALVKESRKTAKL